MPATLSPYVVQIAVSSNGNPVVEVMERAPGFLPHPTFPPVALPAAEFPSAIAAESYAERLLQTAGLLTPGRPLVFVSSGYTLVNGQRFAARRAPLPAATPAPQAI